jgi:PAS domain S-box-containing protein
MFDSDIKILNLLFKIMPFVFWKGRDGRYLGGNDNQAHAFGFSSPDDFIGKTIFEIIEDQDLAKIIENNDNKIMNSGVGITIEETFMTHTGKKVYLTQKNPILDDNKKVIGLIGFAMDITDIKAKQQQVEEANRKLVIEKYELEIASYQAEKQSQEKVRKFIDKILNELQSFRGRTRIRKLSYIKDNSNPIFPQ